MNEQFSIEDINKAVERLIEKLEQPIEVQIDNFIRADVNTIITGDTNSDYVKVVHCKDCKFYKSYCDKYKSFCAYVITEYDKHNGECNYIGMRTGVFDEVNETDFCSRGERKENNG